jgi:VIT1/CCC1 family predicted Fe2+/Mn2+ transporter
MVLQRNAAYLQDAILGGQDGLVNVLGLSLGVFASTTDPHLVIVSGLAAMFAESISMGACAYTSAKAAMHYEVKNAREADFGRKEVDAMLAKSGLTGVRLEFAKRKLLANIEDEGSAGPLKRGARVWFSTMIGSAVPLAPYFLLPVMQAAAVSLALSVLVLFATGVVKAKFTLGSWKIAGLEMVGVGALAAVAGFIIGSILKVSA